MAEEKRKVIGYKLEVTPHTSAMFREDWTVERFATLQLGLLNDFVVQMERHIDDINPRRSVRHIDYFTTDIIPVYEEVEEDD